MQKFWLLALLLFALPARADIVDYTLTVQNLEPIGDFSWTIAHDGFIQVTPALFDDNGDCTNCDRYNFDTFVSVSAPSNGDGCGITGVFLDPEYSPTTFFSPLCDGLYDSTTGGAFPIIGVLGTWTWAGTYPDGTVGRITTTISEARGVPEPGTWALLGTGLLSLLALGRISRLKCLCARVSSRAPLRASPS